MHDEKKVEYLELIYDLIFVYIIGRNNSLLHHTADGRIQPEMFVTYFVCTLAVIQIWNFSSYYINIYGKNGLQEHIFLFSNMFLLYFIAEGTQEHWEKYHTQYHIAWALILVNVAVQYLIEFKNQEKRFRYKRNIFVLVAEALLVLLTIPVYRYTGYELSFIPIVFGIIAASISTNYSENIKVDFAHLSERAMLYVVFTFGEMVIAIAGYFKDNMSIEGLYFPLMAFLIVVGLFLSYGTFYDRIIDREQSTNGLWYMFLHIFIIFGLNNITTALEFMQNDKMELMSKMGFLIGSFLLYYIFLFMTRKFAKKSCRPPISFYLKMAGIGISFIALMLIFRENMQINILISVIYVFAVYAIIYGIGRVNSKVKSKSEEN